MLWDLATGPSRRKKAMELSMLYITDWTKLKKCYCFCFYCTCLKATVMGRNPEGDVVVQRVTSWFREYKKGAESH